MRTNLNDLQRALDILDNVDLSRGSRTPGRVLNKLTEHLSDRQRKLLTEEERQQVAEGSNFGLMKKLLGMSVFHIMRRQAANIMADLIAQDRRNVKLTEHELDILLRASKGDIGKKQKDKKQAIEIMKKIAMELDRVEAKREKRDPWAPRPIDVRPPKALTSGS